MTGAGASSHDHQLLAVKDLPDLAAGVVRPGADGVELEVAHPVAEGLAALVLALIGQRQVVVGVGVPGSEANGGTVGVNGLAEPLQLVEHVAQIEEGQRVVRIGESRLAVKALGSGELALVIEDGPEVDGGGGVAGIEPEYVLVKLGRLDLLACLFEAYGLKKEASGAVDDLRRTEDRDFLFNQIVVALEVEDELACDRLHHGAGMAEEQARSISYRGRFLQRVGHAGDGLHGMNAGADTGRREAGGAEIAQLAQLNEILKAVGVGKGNKACMLPRSQLFGADAEDAKDILTAIAGHSGCARKTTVTHLKVDYRCVR